jgi:hypothetical protein
MDKVDAPQPHSQHVMLSTPLSQGGVQQPWLTQRYQNRDAVEPVYFNNDMSDATVSPMQQRMSLDSGAINGFADSVVGQQSQADRGSRNRTANLNNGPTNAVAASVLEKMSGISGAASQLTQNDSVMNTSIRASNEAAAKVLEDMVDISGPASQLKQRNWDEKSDGNNRSMDDVAATVLERMSGIAGPGNQLTQSYQNQSADTDRKNDRSADILLELSHSKNTSSFSSPSLGDKSGTMSTKTTDHYAPSKVLPNRIPINADDLYSAPGIVMFSPQPALYQGRVGMSHGISTEPQIPFDLTTAPLSSSSKLYNQTLPNNNRTSAQPSSAMVHRVIDQPLALNSHVMNSIPTVPSPDAPINGSSTAELKNLYSKDGAKVDNSTVTDLVGWLAGSSDAKSTPLSPSKNYARGTVSELINKISRNDSSNPTVTGTGSPDVTDNKGHAMFSVNELLTWLTNKTSHENPIQS